MTPHPPYLPPIIHEWEPEELFYIVKHGVKFTGMPAWPSQQRDDEVWAIVAFLNKFPELNQQEYREMVSSENFLSSEDAPIQALSGRTRALRSIGDNCVRCHGVEGRGRTAGVAPKLAGQQAAYLERALTAYKQGGRHSGVMEPISAALNDVEIEELSRYFSEPEVMPITQRSTSSELAINRGEAIPKKGLTENTYPHVCRMPWAQPKYTKRRLSHPRRPIRQLHKVAAWSFCR